MSNHEYRLGVDLIQTLEMLKKEYKGELTIEKVWEARQPEVDYFMGNMTALYQQIEFWRAKAKKHGEV